jgi:hypothetical protein
VLAELVGLAKGADQTTLGKWLQVQAPKSVEAVMSVNWDFGTWWLKRLS